MSLVRIAAVVVGLAAPAQAEKSRQLRPPLPLGETQAGTGGGVRGGFVQAGGVSTLTPTLSLEGRGGNSGVAGGAFSIPLTVRDASGTARTGEPVRSGIPFPEGLLKDATGVSIATAAGDPVPGQFRTLARWPDGSVRWLLVDCLATVPAGGEAHYILQPARGKAPATSLAVTETAQTLAVTTGPLKFTVDRRRFDLVHEAWLDLNGDGTFAADEQLIQPHAQGGFALITGPRIEVVEEQAQYFDFSRIRPVLGVAKDEVWKIAWTRQGPRKGTTFNDYYEVVGEKTGPDGEAQNYDSWTTKSGALAINGPLQVYPKPGREFVRFRVIPEGETYRMTPHGPAAVTVEERGPVRVVIRAEGYLVTADGTRLGGGRQDHLQPTVVIRLHAWAGRSEIAVSCQVRSPRQDIDLAEGYLAVALAGQRRDGRLWKYPVGTDDAWLEIARPTRILPGGTHWGGLFHPNTRTVDVTRLSRAGGAPVETEETGAGSASISNQAGALGVLQRYVAHNQPQRMALEKNLLKVVLWPRGRTTQRLDRATQKTYDLLLTLGPGAREAAWQRDLARVEHPLHAMAEPAWHADTMALGRIAEARDPADLPDEVRDAYAKFEKVQLGKVDPTVWAGGGPPERTVFASTYRTWQDFGNLPWSDGRSNLHYDWPWSMLLHYLRTGERRFFDAGELMSWCRRDRIQIWDFAGPAYGRLARYEKSIGRPNPTHTWSRGLFTYHFLTGDPGALEAALETTEGVRQYWFDWGYAFGGKPDKKVHWPELRSQGWTIDNMLNAYEWSGEAVWLDRAKRLFRDSLLYMDQEAGLTGMCSKEKLQPLMAGYLVGPLCRLLDYLERAGDAEAQDLLAFLKRMYVDVVRKKMVLGGEAAGGTYVPFTFTYTWQPDRTYTLKDADSGIYTQFFADAYATLYLSEPRDEYLAWARQFFRDGMHHVPGPYHCPSVFPGTNTKIHGWSGRVNQVYLYLEKKRAAVSDQR